MIEIVSRYDETKVLYRAENAQDVRAAVVEAVKGGAYLGGAYLGGAYLRGANLRGADLGDANLRGANLRDAYSPRHPLYTTKLDLFAILDAAPLEVSALAEALEAGKVDGATYTGTCACLVGTICKSAGWDAEDLSDHGIVKDASRPAEKWFAPIKPGDIPTTEPEEDDSEGTFRARTALEWIEEWQTSRTAIAKVLA